MLAGKGAPAGGMRRLFAAGRDRAAGEWPGVRGSRRRDPRTYG